MAKNSILTLVASAAFASSLSVAHAAENPFAMKSMEKGYMVAESGDKAKEAKCGGDKKAVEAKCGGDMKAKEAKCGGEMKVKEAKCGGSKKAVEAKCGGAK